MWMVCNNDNESCIYIYKYVHIHTLGFYRVWNVGSRQYWLADSKHLKNKMRFDVYITSNTNVNTLRE